MGETKIVTVTLNPAVDKTCEITRLIPGQVNRVERVVNLAGGKGVNVTKVLRQYGYAVKALGILGGYTGDFIEEHVRKIGAECCFTHVAGRTRTSTNILAGDGYITELVEPGPAVSKEEQELFVQNYQQEILDSEYVVLSGSIPEQMPVDFYARLVELATQKGKKVLLDSSGEALREGVKAVPYMIKPNRRELEILCSRKLKGIEDVIGAAVSCQKQGIAHVLVSMGAKGMLYVGKQEILYGKAPQVRTINTVGCGDSAVAAFLIASLRRLPVREMLKFCVAVSAANATTLESAVIPMERAEELWDRVVIEEY